MLTQTPGGWEGKKGGEMSNEHETHDEQKEPQAHKDLHIFVNRRKFDRGDGVKEEMTGAEIAALVGVPAENAVIREEEPNKREIGVNETLHIKNGEHFLVTRKVVEGGYGA
jgi:hypothetical protein